MWTRTPTVAKALISPFWMAVVHVTHQTKISKCTLNTFSCHFPPIFLAFLSVVVCSDVFSSVPIMLIQRGWWLHAEAGSKMVWHTILWGQSYKNYTTIQHVYFKNSFFIHFRPVLDTFFLPHEMKHTQTLWGTKNKHAKMIGTCAAEVVWHRYQYRCALRFGLLFFVPWRQKVLKITWLSFLVVI